jgi:hypothetical protein
MYICFFSFADISSRVVDPLGLAVSTSSCLPSAHGWKSRATSSKGSTSASSSAGHLSSTLEKLWAWEKKLYQEIKVHTSALLWEKTL